MSKTWRTVLWVVGICGGAALVAAVAIGSMLAIALPGEKIDRARPKDMAGVLDAANIGKEVKILRVVHSYVSARNPVSGDHCNAYCMEIDRFPESIIGKDDFESGNWLAGPVSDLALQGPLQNACSWPRFYQMDWFPSAEQVNTNRFYISFLGATEFGSQGRHVCMVAYDRESGLLYFSDARW